MDARQSTYDMLYYYSLYIGPSELDWNDFFVSWPFKCVPFSVVPNRQNGAPCRTKCINRFKCTHILMGNTHTHCLSSYSNHTSSKFDPFAINPPQIP